MDFGRGVARRGARPTARATKAQRGIRPGRRAMNCGTLKGLCRDAFYRLLRRAYANEVWAHVELAAVEENGGAEVLKAAVALGGGLERLYRRVEPFREGVVDAAVEPRQKAVEVILQRVGDLDHELVPALPEPPEQFLEPPCLARVEMPPCPLWLLVVKRHQPSAYRADRGALRILQPDVDAAGGHIKLHVGDVPLLAKSKERGIVLVENVFHADIIPHLQGGCVARSREAVARTPTVGVSNCTFQAALSTKNSEEP